MRIAEKSKVGRPSSYAPEVAAKVCELLASGKSLRQVCLTPGMPDRNTILRWGDSVPEFGIDLARAREDCADWHADQGLAELQQCKGLSKEHVAAAREIAKYHLALAKVIDPHRYGDQSRFQVEHSGSVGQSMQVSVVVKGYDPLPPAIDVASVDNALHVSNGNVQK